MKFKITILQTLLKDFSFYQMTENSKFQLLLICKQSLFKAKKTKEWCVQF